MAPLDWSQCPAVERIPGKVSGAWVFKGTRTPVSVVFENLEDGMTIDEVMEQFPVTRDQVKTVLEFAVRSLDAPAPGRDARALRQRNGKSRRRYTGLPCPTKQESCAATQRFWEERPCSLAPAFL